MLIRRFPRVAFLLMLSAFRTIPCFAILVVVVALNRMAQTRHLLFAFFFLMLLLPCLDFSSKPLKKKRQLVRTHETQDSGKAEPRHTPLHFPHHYLVFFFLHGKISEWILSVILMLSRTYDYLGVMMMMMMKRTRPNLCFNQIQEDRQFMLRRKECN